MARGVRQVRPVVRVESLKIGDDKYWRERAACKNMDPDLWYEGSKVPLGGVRIDPYKICGACPVVAECLKDALETEGADTYGIRGGMSAEDRRIIIRGWRFKNAQG